MILASADERQWNRNRNTFASLKLRLNFFGRMNESATLVLLSMAIQL